MARRGRRLGGADPIAVVPCNEQLAGPQRQLGGVDTSFPVFSWAKFTKISEQFRDPRPRAWEHAPSSLEAFMQLTSELVAKVSRAATENGPSPGFVPMNDGDYEALTDDLLLHRPSSGPLWVFAYGSLLWKPAFEFIEERHAVAPGWHRTFRLKLTRWRGTPDRPGLMLVLDRGGLCRGMVQRLPDADIRGGLIALLRREVSNRNTTNQPRWISVMVDGGRSRAIAFCANRAGPAYTGRQPIETTADMLATAAGHAGSCADYLLRTVESLEKRGIRDRGLWRLQAMVAERIRSAHQAGGARS